MIPEIGTGIVHFALFFAAAGSVLGLWSGARGHLHGWVWARRATWGFVASMFAANAVMIYALLTRDFSVAYVAEVGSHSTPNLITVISLWASLNGSILFWGGVLALYLGGFLLLEGRGHRDYLPFTIGVQLLVSVFFALLIASVANPFARISPVPLDGPGPNPLLQNHWLMAIHPPVLYLGYVGMVVPYSMICAALLAGRLDAGWMVPLRRWMLIPWGFLSLGIVLGGWWSYEVLGWGGAWAWDPVENASFHPWLTGTAFLHSAMLFQRRGDLRIWTLTLGMATFLLTLVGTFMTRSGVFNSVHSFTQSDIGPVFLWFIGIVLTASVVLLAVREHTLAEPSDAQPSLIQSTFGRSMHPLGREFAILLQNALFTVFTFTVLLGTLQPLIVEALRDEKISVGEPYFDKWALPLGLGIVFLMGVGPALPWGKLSTARIGRKLGVPAAFGVLFALPFVLSGINGPIVTLTLWICGFALAANAAELIEPVVARMRSRGEAPHIATWSVLKRTRRRFGGHLAHYGVIMAVVSLALTKGYKVEQDASLRSGESLSLGAYTATYRSSALVREPHRQAVEARFDVSRAGSSVGSLAPRMNYYSSQREPIHTPAVHSTWASDLYLTILELPSDGSYVVIRAMHQPGVVWLWIAPFLILAGSGIAAWPAKRRGAAEAAATETAA